jgi:CheY-like chemotaxis protein
VRLEFNVLWVEDQPDRVAAQRKRIERVIREEGFQLDVVFAASVLEASRYLSDDIYGDHIDLILMDYDLDGSANGDQGLIQAREMFPYKDIIFYSARANDLVEIVHANHLQGIFCSTRDDLPETVEGVFEALVKKVVDIDHSRGIVMGATSDIDYFVNDALLSLFNACEEQEQQQVISLVTLRMKEIRERFDLSATEVEAIKTVADLLDKHHIYTSVDRIQLLRKALGLKSLHPKECKALGRYANDVAPKRNDLAHVRVQKEGFSRKLLDRKGKEFTREEMRALRLTLLENREVFRALADALTPDEA